VNPSVTTWIGLLQTGQEEAAQKLWERFFPPLVRLAGAKLRGASRRDEDEEDVALSAFHSFCNAATRGQIPQLNDREDLWRTLVLITCGKVVDRRRYQQAQKRGGPSGGAEADLALLEEVVGHEPDPAFAAAMAEECERLLGRLEDDEMRQMALLKLEGYTTEEIGARLGCSVRTVKRRLALVRRTWESPGGK
jgi:DNA-directed RNA polymerase specialized sigma24 family protein